MSPYLKKKPSDTNSSQPSTSTCPARSQSPSPSGRAILNDMFLSRCLNGIRASLFQCLEDRLRSTCSLHGLDIMPTSNVRDLKVRLLYHVINGDCFSDRCTTSTPSPDRSACLCIASSSLSIMTFVVQILKASMPSVVRIDDLLLVVESTGSQRPYKSRIYLRRQLLASLEAFVSLSRFCAQRQSQCPTTDPYADLLVSFEDKRRPVLESVMNHHGLVVERERRLSPEDMRNSIVSHISSGNCVKGIGKSQPWFSHTTSD